ncbi:hypothetical protein ACH5RR_005695 [Cinchona calisaya]|uniref:Dof zinc finger protein n=1 Tax=Cinchona calisaya TaxID=153742 RepID=A0ABD3AM69_9GENT
MERGWKSNVVEISPACPRCGSTNTKFCYYNNYSLTQPRYFCKGCRRYWTKGGSLRNIPVGGVCRKSRRGKPFRASSIEGNNVSPFRGFAGEPASLGQIGTTPILSNGSLAATAAEGSNNIDLALVYANFLNQKPEVEADKPHHHQIEIPILPNNDQFSSVESIHMDLMTNIQLSRESGFVEYRSLIDGNAFYFSGLESIEKQQASNYHELNQINNYTMPPPLPDEEELLRVSGGMVWSTTGSNDQIMFPSHANQFHQNGSQFNVSIELCNVLRPRSTTSFP